MSLLLSEILLLRKEVLDLQLDIAFRNTYIFLTLP